MIRNNPFTEGWNANLVTGLGLAALFLYKGLFILEKNIHNLQNRVIIRLFTETHLYLSHQSTVVLSWTVDSLPILHDPHPIWNSISFGLVGCPDYDKYIMLPFPKFLMKDFAKTDVQPQCRLINDDHVGATNKSASKCYLFGSSSRKFVWLHSPKLLRNVELIENEFYFFSLLNNWNGGFT